MMLKGRQANAVSRGWTAHGRALDISGWRPLLMIDNHGRWRPSDSDSILRSLQQSDISMISSEKGISGGSAIISNIFISANENIF